MQLTQALSQTKFDINQFLEHFFDERIAESSQIDRHIGTMTTLLKHQSLAGGKRVRGFLCLLAYHLSGGKSDAIPVAAAVELLHQYLLTLDDMADRDEVRHGIPTLEHEYVNTLTPIPQHHRTHYARSFTEIACALLSTYMYELVISSSFSDNIKLDVMHIMNTISLRDTAAGWQIHMMQNWQTLAEATEEEFEKGLQLVTAQYTFVAPLLIGVTLANKRKTYEQSLTTYGMHVGTAFQMHDDILGVFGDTEKTGKAVGNDLREGKKTILLQYAYAHANAKQKKDLERIVCSSVSPKDLLHVQEILQETRAVEYAHKKAQEHVRIGLQALESLPQSQEKQLLTELAHYIIERDV